MTPTRQPQTALAVIAHPSKPNDCRHRQIDGYSVKTRAASLGKTEAAVNFRSSRTSRLRSPMNTDLPFDCSVCEPAKFDDEFRCSSAKLEHSRPKPAARRFCCHNSDCCSVSTCGTYNGYCESQQQQLQLIHSALTHVPRRAAGPYSVGAAPPPMQSSPLPPQLHHSWLSSS